MKTIKARGVVLREYEAGESDKRLVLLCKELGRLTVYARGARKPKSKFMAAAQIFAYGDYVLTDSGTFYAVAQAEVIDSFYGVRNDYARLCHAHYIAEICERTLLENTACDDVLRLLLRTLGHLARTTGTTFTVPPAQASCVFLFRFFLYYGLAPETDGCSVCGKEVEQFAQPSPQSTTPPHSTKGDIFFCDEGLVCPSCAVGKPDRVRLSEAALAALRYILGNDTNNTSKAFLFTVKDTVLTELTRAGRLFWATHFDIKLHSVAWLS